LAVFFLDLGGSFLFSVVWFELDLREPLVGWWCGRLQSFVFIRGWVDCYGFGLLVSVGR
jgi:hypothetical protein